MINLARAQTLPDQPIWKYVLLKGSEFIIECPICALAPITQPLQGTMELQAVEFTPGFALYAVTNIVFIAGAPGGPQSKLSGAGTYQAPGLPSFGQRMSLDLNVLYQSSQSEAFFTNPVTTVTINMPVIQINLDQTNGSPARLFHLKLLAAPVLQLVSIVPEVQSGSVRLDWLSNGLPVQVERAVTVNGPFLSVGDLTTDESFVDTGVLTNQTSLFYRLRWNGP